jgi:hypothetical protein
METRRPMSRKLRDLLCTQHYFYFYFSLFLFFSLFFTAAIQEEFGIRKTGLILGHDRNQYQSSQEGTQGAAKWRQEDR